MSNAMEKSRKIIIYRQIMRWDHEELLEMLVTFLVFALLAILGLVAFLFWMWPVTFLIRHLQGDTTCWFEPPVDIKTKVVF